MPEMYPKYARNTPDHFPNFTRIPRNLHGTAPAPAWYPAPGWYLYDQVGQQLGTRMRTCMLVLIGWMDGAVKEIQDFFAVQVPVITTQ